MFWQIFEQVLSELEPLCLAEQDFISKFFKLQPLAVQPPLAQVDHSKCSNFEEKLPVMQFVCQLFLLLASSS